MRYWQSMLLAVVLVGFATQANADRGDCGQPITTGPHPTSTDALYTLRAAIGTQECENGVCDVDADCQISASDALLTLTNSLMGMDFDDCAASCDEPLPCGKSTAPQCGGLCPAGEACILDEFGVSGWYAVNSDFDDDSDNDADSDLNNDSDDDADSDLNDDSDDDADSDADRDSDDDADSDGDSDDNPGLNCICFPTDFPATTTTLPSPETTTTTLTSPTTTTTTLAPPPTVPGTTTTSTTTTSTTTTSTTTTTLGVDPVLGNPIYDTVCFACHKAGTYDDMGFAPDLAGKGSKLKNDISSITGRHPSGLNYTDAEIATLRAFLDGL